MAVNYATKYSPLVDEKFSRESVTMAAVNNNYDFIGAQSVRVYSIPTVDLKDYTANGDNRFGTPTELDTSTQELKMSQDKAFTFTVDRKTEMDTPLEQVAGQALAREIREVVIPAVDKYRLAKMVTEAANEVVGTVSKGNAYELFLDVNTELTDKSVPMIGRVAYVTAKFYKFIKLDDAFTKRGDMATEIAITGAVGEVDGIPIIVVPGPYLPGNVDLLITHPMACPSPVKLEMYRILEDQRGIDGKVVEGRIYYDCFVLSNKKNAIGYLTSATLKG